MQKTAVKPAHCIVRGLYGALMLALAGNQVGQGRAQLAQVLGLMRSSVSLPGLSWSGPGFLQPNHLVLDRREPLAFSGPGG